jgi:hypothetical protein
MDLTDDADAASLVQVGGSSLDLLMAFSVLFFTTP